MKEYRKNQYDKNCELIDMIRDHINCGIIEEKIHNVICEELELDISSFLDAYLDNDADAMACAITGWDLESLLAKAKVIPDVKNNFYSDGEVPSGDITFPTYGKETLTPQEFIDYLRHENHKLPVETLRMVQNAMICARNLCKTADEQRDFLCSMLNGVLDIDEDTIRKVVL